MEAKSRVAESSVAFDGATGPLHGRLLALAGPLQAALVVAHGRTGDMDEPLVAGLARRGAEIGLWTMRFNFAFRELGAEPSAGFEDEIGDLREAIAFARRTSGVDRIIVAGRGLGAWPTVAAVTDEDAEDAILLGPSFMGQSERTMALRRLGEFEIATLVVVGASSDRADVPALQELLRGMRTVRLEVIPGADHRLRDSHGGPMLDAVLPRCEAWLRERME